MTRPNIDARFRAFHAAHPDIYCTFKIWALRKLWEGATRISAKGLMEDLREKFGPSIELQSSTSDSCSSRYSILTWKLDNSFTALYARMLLDECPQFEGIMEVRCRKGERKRCGQRVGKSTQQMMIF